MIFLAKILFSAICHQKTYFLLGLEENEYAGIKHPINLKPTQELLLIRILAQRGEKWSGFHFFAILKCPC